MNDIKQAFANEKAKFIYGVDGYIAAINKRGEVKASPILQLVNGKEVAKYHTKTGPFIHEFISKRVEMGLVMKNLVMFEDRVLEIEKTDSSKLKECRYLPEEFRFGGILAIFGECVTWTSLDENNSFTIIIEDKVTADSYRSVFNLLWPMGVQF